MGVYIGLTNLLLAAHKNFTVRSFSKGMKYVLIAVAMGVLAAKTNAVADPRVESWYTKDSKNFARIYPTASDQREGNAVTTWAWGPGVQSVPVLAGVHDVSYSKDWVYIHTSGLASYVMGPWYDDAAKTRLFPSYPADTRTIYRIPRSTSVSANKTLTGLGPIGYFVNGVALFDNRDAHYWNGKFDAQGEGIWNRDAYVNEGVTFDAGMAHQARSQYHYHANPIALRYQLGDHVDYDAANNRYHESATALTKHSPIVAWARDGLPIYGPYGFSDPKNLKSKVRRMVSGYVVRDGKYGTQNLAVTGRTSVPQWAQRAYHLSGGLRTSEYGPNVNASAPLGRYIEDNDYLGDLGKKQGVDFDLNEFNARFCVTPEFPNGTWAYFVTIDSNGKPSFPYNIGHSFYATPSGGMVRNIDETVTTSFAASNDAPESSNATVSLIWDTQNGGKYAVSR